MAFHQVDTSTEAREKAERAYILTIVTLHLEKLMKRGDISAFRVINVTGSGGKYTANVVLSSEVNTINFEVNLNDI